METRASEEGGAEKGSHVRADERTLPYFSQ
jgi:hypothetical protein